MFCDPGRRRVEIDRRGLALEDQWKYLAVMNLLAGNGDGFDVNHKGFLRKHLRRVRFSGRNRWQTNEYPLRRFRPLKRTLRNSFRQRLALSLRKKQQQKCADKE